MKKLFSFLMITLLMFIVIEFFHSEDFSMTSHDLNYTFTTDALASHNKGDVTRPTIRKSKLDPTTLLLLGSGLIGLAGFGRKRIK